MELVDLDGDSHLDLVDVSGDGLRVLLNDGNGGAGSIQTLSTLSSGNYDLVVGDFDLDGDIDAATAVFTAQDRVQVMTNDGTGAFSFGVSLPFFSEFFPVPALHGFDLHDDGDLDLVWSPGSSQIMYGVNPGDGNFIGPIADSVPASARDIASGDLDADGQTDLIVVAQHSTHVYAGVATGLPTPGESFASPWFDLDETLLVGDLNGDLRDDLVFGSAPLLTILENRGDATFPQPTVTLAQGGLRSEILPRPTTPATAPRTPCCFATPRLPRR